MVDLQMCRATQGEKLASCRFCSPAAQQTARLCVLSSAITRRDTKHCMQIRTADFFRQREQDSTPCHPVACQRHWGSTSISALMFVVIWRIASGGPGHRCNQHRNLAYSCNYIIHKQVHSADCVVSSSTPRSLLQQNTRPNLLTITSIVVLIRGPPF